MTGRTSSRTAQRTILSAGYTKARLCRCIRPPV